MRNWDEYEQYRKTYAFEIPPKVILDMLVIMAWNTMEDYNYDPPPLVTFRPTGPDNPEDSWFEVLGSDNDMKTSLPDAVKKAFFKLSDKRKEERRTQYEELKKEFEPEKTQADVQDGTVSPV